MCVACAALVCCCGPRRDVHECFAKVQDLSLSTPAVALVLSCRQDYDQD